MVSFVVVNAMAFYYKYYSGTRPPPVILPKPRPLCSTPEELHSIFNSSLLGPTGTIAAISYDPLLFPMPHPCSKWVGCQRANARASLASGFIEETTDNVCHIKMLNLHVRLQRP